MLKPKSCRLLARAATLIAGLSAILANVDARTTDETNPTPTDYAAATALLEGNLQGLVRNESVEPHWLGASGRFWYRRDGNDGPEFILVTARGEKSAAFDHVRLAQAVSQALAEPNIAKTLPASLTHVQLSDDLTRLSGQIDKQSIDCDLKTYQCHSFVPPLAQKFLASPDGRLLAFARDDNLFVRQVATGQERQLTTDGAAYYSWGKLPDGSFNTVVRLKSGAETPPYETYWSPDGRYLIAPRIDERKVGIYPFLESVPTDGSRRPIVHDVRMVFTGDRDTVEMNYFLFDLKTGRRTAIELPQGYPRPHFNGLVFGWSSGRGQAFLMVATFASKAIVVLRLDLTTEK